MAVIAKWSGIGVATGQTLTTSLAGTGDTAFSALSITGTAQTASGGSGPGTWISYTPSGVACYAEWGSTVVGSRTAFSARVYYQWSAWASQSATMIRAYNGTNQVWGVDIGGSGSPGQIRLRDANNTQIGQTSTGVLSTGADMRLEVRWSTSGTINIAAYAGESTTTLGTLTGTVGTAAITMIRWGPISGGVAWPQYYARDYAIGDADVYLGPVPNLTNASPSGAAGVVRVRASAGSVSAGSGSSSASPAGHAGVIVTRATGVAEQTRLFDFEAGAAGSWDVSSNTDVSAGYARVGTYGVRLDSRTTAARLRLNTSSIAAGRLSASWRAWFRLPLGIVASTNQGLWRGRNTDPLAAGGGGNADIWVDSGTSTIRGDLQPTDSFVGPVITAGQWYLIHVAIRFGPDATSRMRVKLNNVEIADVTSTLNAAGQTISFLEWASSTVSNEVIDYDDVLIRVSDAELGYLPDIASPQGSAGVVRVAASAGSIAAQLRASPAGTAGTVRLAASAASVAAVRKASPAGQTGTMLVRASAGTVAATSLAHPVGAAGAVRIRAGAGAVAALVRATPSAVAGVVQIAAATGTVAAVRNASPSGSAGSIRVRGIAGVVATGSIAHPSGPAGVIAARGGAGRVAAVQIASPTAAAGAIRVRASAGVVATGVIASPRGTAGAIRTSASAGTVHAAQAAAPAGAAGRVLVRPGSGTVTAARRATPTGAAGVIVTRAAAGIVAAGSIATAHPAGSAGAIRIAGVAGTVSATSGPTSAAPAGRAGVILVRPGAGQVSGGITASPAGRAGALRIAGGYGTIAVTSAGSVTVTGAAGRILTRGGAATVTTQRHAHMVGKTGVIRISSGSGRILIVEPGHLDLVVGSPTFGWPVDGPSTLWPVGAPTIGQEA